MPVRRSRITAAIFGSTNTQFGSQWSSNDESQVLKSMVESKIQKCSHRNSQGMHYVKKNMMCQQQVQQQHILQLHQDHLITCKLITYCCLLVREKTDILVVIDTRWIEAYPTGRATAAHTAKCLVTDLIPRWGLPDCIDSDQGTHFTGHVVKEVSKMLKIEWNLHFPLGM